jgi:hypothetical protein
MLPRMKRTTRNRLRALAGVALVGVLGVAVPQVWAPTQNAEAFPITALDLGGTSHGDITVTAFQTILREAYGITNPNLAQDAAADRVAAGNEAVDDDQISSAKHFDGENFDGGKSQIVSNFNRAISLARAGDPNRAQTSFGAAMHTLQDFYAHTNWVELGNRGINPNLYNGRSIGTVAGPLEQTCDLADGGRLVTTKLTSGYYGGEDRAPQVAGKCRHGGPTDLSLGLGGLNKDFDNVVLSPHAAFHDEAVRVAGEATMQALRDLKFNLEVRDASGTIIIDDSAARAFFAVPLL